MLNKSLLSLIKLGERIIYIVLNMKRNALKELLKANEMQTSKGSFGISYNT